MNRVLFLLIGIAIGVLAMQVVEWPQQRGPAPSAESDDDEDDEATTRLERHGQHVRVILNAAEIELAGIEIGALEHRTVRPETATAGRVVQTAELLTVLRDLRSARTTADASRAVVSTLEARVGRLRSLAAGGEITVARELAALEVEYRRELATASAREAHVAQLSTALLGRWGSALARLAADREGPLAAVEKGAALLVEFAAAVDPPPTIFVASGDARDAAVPARVLGPGATSLGGARGASWLALVASPELRAGMPLTVWLPSTAAPVDGVWMPATAVVWHRGSQWYYRADDDTHFSRHALGDVLPHADGYLLAAAQAPPGRVVLRGAQLLLAEEFRDAIPEEDDD